MVAFLATIALLSAQTDFPTRALGIGYVQTVEGNSIKISVPNKKATVLFFITVDCPIANRYAPEMARIAKEYAPKGFAFIRVYPEKILTSEMVAKHGKDFNLDTMPAIIDSKHFIVDKIRPTVTPEAAIVAADGRLLYRGRIDAAYMDHGRFTDTPERRDLREALADILSNKPVRLRNVPAVGCDIPDIN